MTRDEIIELHGEDAWDWLVKPRQDRKVFPTPMAQNANAIVHHDVIGPVLILLGFKANSLLEAKTELERLRAAQPPPATATA